MFEEVKNSSITIPKQEELKESVEVNHDLEAVIETEENAALDNTVIGDNEESESIESNIEINNTIMESAIGLNKRYRLDNLVNAKGKPLKRFVAYRNYYNISAGCDRYDAIQELVKIGFMNEYRKDFYEVTEKGIKYLENKYKIKIYFYD